MPLHLVRYPQRRKTPSFPAKGGHADNADVNAALVIRERFLDPLLRNKLHDRDVRGRFRPKDKDPSSVMEILLRARNPRVVTELLSNP